MPSERDVRRAARGLAVLRIVAGAGAIGAPAVVLRTLGVDAHRDPGAVVPAVMFGAREVFLGATALRPGPTGAWAHGAGIAVDAIDLYGALTARRKSVIDTAPAATLAVGAALAIGTGIAAWLDARPR